MLSRAFDDYYYAFTFQYCFFVSPEFDRLKVPGLDDV